MLLHDVVGVNREKGATTENQGAGVKYMGQRAKVWLLGLCYLTWYDYSSLVGGGRKSWYIIIINMESTWYYMFFQFDSLIMLL